MLNTRREFFWKLAGVLVVVPAGAALIGCSKSDDDCADANKVVATTTTLTVTSECNEHTHDFSIMLSDLATPPTTGVSGNTTPYDDDGHVHVVTLSMADLAQIQSGVTVMSTSSNVNAHTHVFMFRKM